jgi:membrane fusion protein (multidrug efflux system)
MEKGQLDRNGEAHDKVRLILEDDTPYPEPGTLKFLDVCVDPTTGSVILRIVFPNPDSVLLPGMFIRAIVQEGVNKKAILIPQQAVTRDPRGNPLTMLVDDEGKVQQRQLTLDRAMGNKWLVSGGLQSGDRVIVEGALKVKPGVSVKTIPFKAEEKDSNAAQPAK